MHAEDIDGLIGRTARQLERIVGVSGGGAPAAFLARRIGAEVQRNGAAPLQHLLDGAESGDGDAALRLRNLVSVKHSAFRREAAHWPILEEQLRTRLRTGLPVRIWSAACANGEEAWSVAMTAADVAADTGPEHVDWRVLASDIDTTALEAAERAEYPERALASLPDGQARRHFEAAPGSDAWQAGWSLRERVDFMRFDLARPRWTRPPGAPFDAIFLSNVLFYFDAPVQARILGNVADCLKPGGVLYTSRTEGNLGHADPRLRPCGDCVYLLAGSR